MIDLFFFLKMKLQILKIKAQRLYFMGDPVSDQPLTFHKRFNTSLLLRPVWLVADCVRSSPSHLPVAVCMQAGRRVTLCAVGGRQLGMYNATLCPTRSQRCPQHTDEQRRAVRVFLLGPSAWVCPVPFLTPTPLFPTSPPTHKCT